MDQTETDRTASGLGSGIYLDHVVHVLAAIRAAKSTAKVSQRAEVDTVTVSGPPEFLAAVRSAESDLRNAGSVIGAVCYTADAERSVVVMLAQTA